MRAPSRAGPHSRAILPAQDVLAIKSGKTLVGSTLQSILFATGAGLLGVVVGYVVAAALGHRRIRQLTTVNRKRLEEVTDQLDQVASKYAKSRSTFKAMKAALLEARAAKETSDDNVRALARDVHTLRTEREHTKIKVGQMQTALDSVNQKTLMLQREFEKAGEFYKRELAKSFAKRKELEKEIDRALSAEREFMERVESSVLEHGSEKEMIVAAQLRFGQIEVLERNIGKLEKENAELLEDLRQAKKDYEALHQDLGEMDELRINNQQLVRCVESLEKRRQQHEEEAEQFRDQADQKEQQSETLRLKLNDLEKSFAAIEQQQQQATADS